MMLKRFAVLLALCLLGGLCLPALAEDAPVFSQAYTLPIDLTGGRPLSESGYTGDTVYEDPSIRVSIETGREMDTDYWIADVYISDPSQLRTVAANSFKSEATARVDRLAKRVNAVLAFNGDYFCYTGSGFIVRQGVEYLRRLGGVRDVLLIDENGDFHTVKHARLDDVAMEIDGKKVINAFYFGPILYDNGQLGTDFDDYEVSWVMSGDWCAQRVAICQAGPLHYKVIVTAGPFRGSTGMKMMEFARFVARQGVTCAYNLDGGNSATLFFHGQKINDPDNPDLRDMSDIIYFASAWEGD